MCVIMFCETQKPTEEMIEKAFNRNSDGAGIAFRAVDTKDKKLKVFWHKGLNLEGIKDQIEQVTLPFVAHFRVNSCGTGSNRKDLCHPFAIDEHASQYLSGVTTGSVLFHNGHWGDWKTVVRDAAIRFAKKIPDGKWTDTRALAWLCYLAGENYMEVLGEKGIIFSPKHEELYWGSSGWHEIGGVWCSNNYFMTNEKSSDVTGAYGRGSGYNPGYPTPGTSMFNQGKPLGPMCEQKSCYTREGIDTSGFCPAHTRRRPNCESESTHPTTPTEVADTKPAGLDSGQAGTVAATPNLTPLPNEEVAGGPLSDNPFVRYQQAEKDLDSGLISRNAFKRARRAFEMSQRPKGIKSQTRRRNRQRREWNSRPVLVKNTTPSQSV